MPIALIPHGLDGGGLRDDGEGVGGHLGARRHYACGAISVVVVLATLLASYSLVVALASTIPLLSTTAIVLLTVIVWALVWLTLDVALLWWSDRRVDA
jgi:hypothetical protein